MRRDLTDEQTAKEAIGSFIATWAEPTQSFYDDLNQMLAAVRREAKEENKEDVQSVPADPEPAWDSMTPAEKTALAEKVKAQTAALISSATKYQDEQAARRNPAQSRENPLTDAERLLLHLASQVRRYQWVPKQLPSCDTSTPVPGAFEPLYLMQLAMAADWVIYEGKSLANAMDIVKRDEDDL